MHISSTKCKFTPAHLHPIDRKPTALTPEASLQPERKQWVSKNRHSVEFCVTVIHDSHESAMPRSPSPGLRIPSYQSCLPLPTLLPIMPSPAYLATDHASPCRVRKVEVVIVANQSRWVGLRQLSDQLGISGSGTIGGHGGRLQRVRRFKPPGSECTYHQGGIIQC